MKTLQHTEEEEEMKTGTHNDYVSYFSMGGSVCTEIIFPLAVISTGSSLHVILIFSVKEFHITLSQKYVFPT